MLSYSAATNEFNQMHQKRQANQRTLTLVCHQTCTTILPRQNSIHTEKDGDVRLFTVTHSLLFTRIDYSLMVEQKQLNGKRHTA